MNDLSFMYQDNDDSDGEDQFAEEVYRVMKLPTKYEASEFLKQDGIKRLITGGENNVL